MDNQEAIRLIRKLPTMCEFTDAYGEPIDSDAYYEAVDIAISALQGQDLQSTCNELAKDTNVPCKDTISRQAAIDALDKRFDSVPMEQTTEILMLRKDLRELPPAQPEQRWIPCDERLPEENHWLGGSGKQFSDEVLVNVVNYDDEDMWVYISQTIDGMWTLELPRHCEITAWCELPEPYKEKNDG